MYLSFLEHSPELLGANLILNTQEEVEIILKNIGKIPNNIILIPYYSANSQLPKEISSSGWYKIHPKIKKITSMDIYALTESVITTNPEGLIIDCFPWGTELEYNVSLPLVLALAKAMPKTFVLVAHGGGYESWAFRAHTGSLQNVIYDFSATLAYYQNSDILKPYQRYLQFSTDRVLFGSDWPMASVTEQILESIRLANEIGISEEKLENIFLSNSRRLWRDICA
jgi:predicted TIM-barrel fold metal-dependent hydrolase